MAGRAPFGRSPPSSRPTKWHRPSHSSPFSFTPQAKPLPTVSPLGLLSPPRQRAPAAPPRRLEPRRTLLLPPSASHPPPLLPRPRLCFTRGKPEVCPHHRHPCRGTRAPWHCVPLVDPCDGGSRRLPGVPPDIAVLLPGRCLVFVLGPVSSPFGCRSCQADPIVVRLFTKPKPPSSSRSFDRRRCTKPILASMQGSPPKSSSLSRRPVRRRQSPPFVVGHRHRFLASCVVVRTPLLAAPSSSSPRCPMLVVLLSAPVQCAGIGHRLCGLDVHGW